MEQFRQQLLNTINNAQLPLEAVYYIFKDVYRDLNDTYLEYQRQSAVAAEKAAIAAQLKEEEGINND